MEILGHFSVPIMHYQVSKDLADQVENHVVDNLTKLNFIEAQHNDYYEKEKVIDLKNDLPGLYTEILKCRDTFEEQTQFLSNKDIDYWVQDYRSEKEYHNLHHHGVYGISGLYWVRANEFAGPIQFKNPNLISHYSDISLDYTEYTARNITYEPRKGFILLFPSYLEHEVLGGKPGIVRTTIAFNFGQKELNNDR